MDSVNTILNSNKFLEQAPELLTLLISLNAEDGETDGHEEKDQGEIESLKEVA